MADREEFLAQHTFSEQGLSIWRRVFETLMQDPTLATQRTAKLLALLIERLEQKEALDGSEIDELLMEVI